MIRVSAPCARYSGARILVESVADCAIAQVESRAKRSTARWKDELVRITDESLRCRSGVKKLDSLVVLVAEAEDQLGGAGVDLLEEWVRDLDFEGFFLPAGDLAEDGGGEWVGPVYREGEGAEVDALDAVGEPDGAVNVVVGGEELGGGWTTVLKPGVFGGQVGLAFVEVAVAAGLIGFCVGVGEVEGDGGGEGKILDDGVGKLAAGGCE